MSCVGDYLGTLMPANTIHSTNVGSMLGQRRRWLANIEATLGERIVFAVMLVAQAETAPAPLSNHVINHLACHWLLSATWGWEHFFKYVAPGK